MPTKCIPLRRKTRQKPISSMYIWHGLTWLYGWPVCHPYYGPTRTGNAYFPTSVHKMDGWKPLDYEKRVFLGHVCKVQPASKPDRSRLWTSGTLVWGAVRLIHNCNWQNVTFGQLLVQRGTTPLWSSAIQSGFAHLVVIPKYCGISWPPNLYDL